jgi:putative nucleotidyltransferase with HDIG domain
MVDMASDLTDAQRVSLLTFDPARECLRIRASKGISSDILRKTSLEVGKGIAGQVAQERRPLRVTSREHAESRSSSSGASYASHSWLSVPLFIGGELLGVLNMTDKADGSDFTEEDEYVAMTLAEKAAIKIENNALYEGIYSNLLDTLRSLVSTLEAKDAYTRHHSQRVTDISLKLARRVGCTEEECESVAFAGVLHDIGKVGINDNILLKTSRLTDAEYTIIKQHPVIGARIIEPLGLIQEERDIILHHHERIDGRGYPDGLKGDEIPFLARIVAIADSFDAMTSTRAYRKPRPMEEVLEEFEKFSGTQFDSDLVPVFLEALEEGEIEAYGVDAEPQIGIEPVAEAEGH